MKNLITWDSLGCLVSADCTGASLSSKESPNKLTTFVTNQGNQVSLIVGHDSLMAVLALA